MQNHQQTQQLDETMIMWKMVIDAISIINTEGKKLFSLRYTQGEKKIQIKAMKNNSNIKQQISEQVFW